MDIFSLELDVIISEYLVERFKSLFTYIHPNLITLLGIGLNYFINIFLNTNNNTITTKQFYLFMFLRWIFDCLDGALARKFNKTSTLGHYLDTISDSLLGFIFGYYIQKNIFNFSFNFTLFLYLIFLTTFNYFTSFFTTHDNIKNKQKSDNIIYKLLGFVVNNSFIYFLLIIFIYNLLYLV